MPFSSGQNTQRQDLINEIYNNINNPYMHANDE